MRGKATNSAIMKSKNQQLVLKEISKAPLSRAQLARATGLTRAAVSFIIDELHSLNLVMETGTAFAEYGRKPVLLDVNPESRYTIGVALSRGSCSIGFVNMKGQIKIKSEIPTSSEKDPGEVIALISMEVNRMLDELHIDPVKVLGMGISTPGPVDIYSGTILNPPNFDKWHGVNIIKSLKKYFSWNIFLDNTAIALTLAEKNYGVGIQFNSFLMLLVNSGVGAGIVINDRIYRGMDGFGSEIGHTSIAVDGKQCSCGNYGCLEMYASVPALLKVAGKRDKNLKSWNDIIDKAETGDKFCMEMVEREARYLAAAIVNTMNLLELEGVILTGYINYKPEMLMDRISQYVQSTLITRDIHQFKLYHSIMPHDANVIAAATILIEKFFDGEIGW